MQERQGEGLQVVAEEVRNLAQRRAEAVKNTTLLIEGAQKNAEDGVNASQEVKSASGLIGNSFSKVS